MFLSAARRLQFRTVLIASAICVALSIFFLANADMTPLTMLVASRSAMMMGLLGLACVASDILSDAVSGQTDGR